MTGSTAVYLRSLGALCFAGLLTLASAGAATLDDLRKLEITCFVPSYLPKGFHFKSAEITYDDSGPDEEKDRKYPLYAIEYGDEAGAAFTIESAREGIGDRNIMEEEDTEETEIKTPLGPVYIIYRPKGKAGRKEEIRANWVTDKTMEAETAKGADAHPVLGRYHGFSGTKMSVAEFTKILQSLHPIRSDTPVAGH